MARTTLFAVSALLALPFLGLGLPAAPQEQDDLAARARRVMALRVPGPEHAVFEDLAGEWQGELHLWYSPDAEEPMVSEAEITAERILGGRFLEVEVVGTMGGMPVTTRHLLGFDRRTEEYTQVTADTMGTYTVSARGVRDPETGEIRMRGADDDPILGVTQVYDFVWRDVTPEGHVYEVVFHDTSHGNVEPYTMVRLVARKAAPEGR